MSLYIHVYNIDDDDDDDDDDNDDDSDGSMILIRQFVHSDIHGFHVYIYIHHEQTSRSDSPIETPQPPQPDLWLSLGGNSSDPSNSPARPSEVKHFLSMQHGVVEKKRVK